MTLSLAGLIVVPVLIFIVKAWQENVEEKGPVQLILGIYALVIAHEMVGLSVRYLKLDGWIVPLTYLAGYIEFTAMAVAMFGGPNSWEEDTRGSRGMTLDYMNVRPTAIRVLMSYFDDLKGCGYANIPYWKEYSWFDLISMAARDNGISPQRYDFVGIDKIPYSSKFDVVKITLTTLAIVLSSRLSVLMRRFIWGIPALWLLYVVGHGLVKSGGIDLRGVSEIDPTASPIIFFLFAMALFVLPRWARSRSALGADKLWRMPFYLSTLGWLFLAACVFLGIPDLERLTATMRVVGLLWVGSCGVFFCVIFGPLIAVREQKTEEFLRAVQRLAEHGSITAVFRAGVLVLGFWMAVEPDYFSQRLFATGNDLRAALAQERKAKQQPPPKLTKPSEKKRKPKPQSGDTV